MTAKMRLATAAAVALGFSTAAWAAEPASTQTLEAKVQALQAEVEALKGQQAQTTANVDATVASVIADADRRSKALSMTGNAGYDDATGFYITSGDGKFLFHPWLQFQPRAVANYTANSKNGGEDDSTTTGFEIRRMKFGFDGNVYSTDLTYAFIWATGRNDGVPVLEEAWARYKFAPEWALKGGQIKDPFAHEGIMSSKKILAVERSYLDDVLGGADNYVQGVTVEYKTDALRVEVGVTDGIRSNNTSFQDAPANFGVAGRVEFKMNGDWKSYEDFSAIGNKNDLLVIGAGGDWTQTGGNNDVFLHTVDLQWENATGLGVYAAYLGRYTKGGDVAPDTYDPGAQLQVAYMLDAQWELFGRYDYTHLDVKGAGGAFVKNDVHEFTAGANYYIHKHNAKFTLDVTYLPNGAPIADTGSDVLANDGHNEWILRGQFQLVL